MAAQWYTLTVKVDNGPEGSRHELPTVEEVASEIRYVLENTKTFAEFDITKVSF